MIGYLASAKILAAFDPILHRRGLAFDQTGRNILELMAEEPGFAQHARALGLDDAIALDLERDVVTDAAAESAGRVLDDLEVLLGLDQADRTHGLRLHSTKPNATPNHYVTFSDPTSNPLHVGMPEPCVLTLIRRLERLPYAMKRSPGGKEGDEWGGPGFLIDSRRRHGNFDLPGLASERTRSPATNPRRSISGRRGGG